MPIDSYEDYRCYTQADISSAGLDRWGIAESCRHPAVRYLRFLRRIEYLMNCRTGLLCTLRLLYLRWRRRRLGFLLGLQIPPNVCGPGFNIVHYGLIIISSQSRIGKNCRIHSGVNIGHWRDGAPQLGDNVYIGPGAKLIGNIRVGDNAVIGANAVVCKDVPAGVTVGGVPARVIATGNSVAAVDEHAGDDVENT